MSESNDLLELELPQGGKNDSDKKEWKQVNKMVERGRLDRTTKLDEIDIITKLYESQGDISEQRGKSFFKGSTYFSAHTRTVNRMRVLKHRTYLHGAPPVLNKIVSAALDLGIKETGLLAALTGRFGAFHRAVLYGDSFILAREAEDKDGYPIRFDPIDCENIYVDPFAVEMQNDSSYQDADEVLITFEYSYDEFVRIFPEVEGTVSSGALPFGKDDPRAESDSHTWNQEQEKESRKIEVGYYLNRSHNLMTVFAGRYATIIAEGELTMKDNKSKPILPVFQLICFPTPRGFYNWGYGHLLARPHRVMRQFLNAATAAVIDRIDPMLYTELPEDEKDQLSAKIEEAMAQKALGKMAIVVFDKKVGETTPVKIEALIGEQLTGDFERLYETYKTEILQMGINLDDIPQQSVDTATQATLREQSINSHVEQIMEGNGHTFEKMYELILTSIRDMTPEDNQFPLRFAEPLTPEDIEQINAEFGDILGEEVTEIRPTLGFVSSILKKYKVTVDVDLRSGAYPDIVSEMARTKELADMLGAVMPGSPAHIRTIRRLAKISGEDFKDEDFAVPAPPAMPAAPIA